MTSPEDCSEAGLRPRSIWPKILGIGCASVLVICVVVASLIAGNWPKLTGYYQQAKSTVSGLAAVQSALQRKYDGTTVRVMARRDNRVRGSILAITLTNASVMNRINLDTQEGRRAALEVAATARDALPLDARYNNYEVTFQRDDASNAGGSMSGSWEFRFTAADLAPGKR